MDQPLRRPDDHAEIREEVAKLCARFPGEYWRKLDAERAYPTEFVQALTEIGLKIKLLGSSPLALSIPVL